MEKKTFGIVIAIVTFAAAVSAAEKSPETVTGLQQHLRINRIWSVEK